MGSMRDYLGVINTNRPVVEHQPREMKVNKNTYCPGAIEKRWVTIDPNDSPIGQLLGILPNGTLISSEGRELGKQIYQKWYEAWKSGDVLPG